MAAWHRRHLVGERCDKCGCIKTAQKYTQRFGYKGSSKRTAVRGVCLICAKEAGHKGAEGARKYRERMAEENKEWIDRKKQDQAKKLVDTGSSNDRVNV